MARSRRPSVRAKGVQDGQLPTAVDVPISEDRMHFGSIEQPLETIEIVLCFPLDSDPKAITASVPLGNGKWVRSSEFADGVLQMDQVGGNDIAYFDQIGVAVLQRNIEDLQALREIARANDSCEIILPGATFATGREAPLQVSNRFPKSRLANYLEGYRDAVNDLASSQGIVTISETRSREATTNRFRDDVAGTWGLHATGVLESRYTGRGVRLAALVDGVDRNHPDWRHRLISMKSFIPGQPDTMGQSGTHYLGTALGTANPFAGPRYGCAPEAIPFVAQIMGPSGTLQRSLSTFFAGLDWALASGCRVILAPLSFGQSGSMQILETVTARVAARGSLLVAGAGNSAARPGSFGFVDSLATCSAVVAVGSIDASMKLPSWTPRSSTAGSRTIDLVAPGVDLRSSVPGAGLYSRWSGSATAAAYVAGIAALWAEALPNATAYELWHALMAHCRLLGHSALDVGSGLVRAP